MLILFIHTKGIPPASFSGSCVGRAWEWGKTLHAHTWSYSEVLFKTLILLVNILYTTICTYAPLSQKKKLN